MKNGKIESIIIAGGGSAGWMTAAYLGRLHPGIRISLVETTDIPTIGVGEATIAHLSRFFHRLGLRDSDWMSDCNASYKYAIRFDDWHEIGERYWHPFEDFARIDSHRHIANYWLYSSRKSGKPVPRDALYDECLLCTRLLDQNRITRLDRANDFNDKFALSYRGKNYPVRVAYAYHFDAGLFGDYLKNRIALPGGVTHIIDEISSIERDAAGDISHINTVSGSALSADLFIDCTGFQSMLIGKTLGEKRDSYSDSLFCNRAIAMQIDYEERDQELRPYTTATAITNGWIWNTPLKNRIGTGYVYCDGFTDPDSAELEYRRYLGEKRVEQYQARHLSFDVGKYRRTWVRNCVAIGLSAGFIEPLESTGIHFIHAAIEKLSAALSGDQYNAGERAAYNHYINLMMEEARDMITLHYGLTNREDTDFWKAAKYDTVFDGGLPELLMLSKHRLPNDKQGYIFGNNSWVCILNGMNHLPQDPYEYIPDDELKIQMQYLAGLGQLRKQLEDKAPTLASVLDET